MLSGSEVAITPDFQMLCSAKRPSDLPRSLWLRGTQGSAAERVPIEVKLDRLELRKIQKLVQIVLQTEIEGPRRKRAERRELIIGD